MRNKNMIVVYGQQGVGKTTILNALLPITANAVKVEGEDIGQVNPNKESEPEFLNLLWQNIACLAKNYWEAGYETFLTGSFYDYLKDHDAFRKYVPKDATVFIVHLCASKPIRDTRRIRRDKPSSKNSRNWVDLHYPEDLAEGIAFKNDHYIKIITDNLSITQTINKIKKALPAIYSK